MARDAKRYLPAIAHKNAGMNMNHKNRVTLKVPTGYPLGNLVYKHYPILDYLKYTIVSKSIKGVNQTVLKIMSTLVRIVLTRRQKGYILLSKIG